MVIAMEIQGAPLLTIMAQHYSLLFAASPWPLLCVCSEQKVPARRIVGFKTYR